MTMTAAKKNNTGVPGILGLTWPIFVELVLQMLVGNADQIMVGWYDPDSVGAIGNANQITNLLILVFSVVCTAAMILISQHLGAGQRENLGRTCTLSLLVNTVFGGAVMVLLLAGCEPIYRSMGVDALIFQETCAYTRIISVGMLLQAIYLTFTAFFRSHQMMRESMIISVMVNLINIGGNAVFINGAFGLPAMGAAGAALASDLSRLVGVGAIGWLFIRRFPGLLSMGHLRPFPGGEFVRLMKIGIPTGGESVSYNASQICIQSICNRMSLVVVNTRVYANMFAMLSYIFASAIGQAAQVVSANLMGAGRLEEIDRLVKRTLLRALAVSAAVSVALFLLARPVYSLFTTQEGVLALCGTIMLIEIPLELGRAVNIVMCRCLQACGDIRFPIAICILSAWITAVGGGFLLGSVLGFGLPGVWAAMACDECLRAVLFLLRWRSGRWKEKCLVERGPRGAE